MKLVGSAFRDNAYNNSKVVVLGIANWGTTAYRNSLINHVIIVFFIIFSYLKTKN